MTYPPHIDMRELGTMGEVIAGITKLIAYILVIPIKLRKKLDSLNSKLDK